jgi:hypothetical protein
VLRVFHHPQRGVVLSADPIQPRCRRYRGGADADWRELPAVRVETGPDGIDRPAPGAIISPGHCWGDPSRQQYGLGGPALVFGPLEKVCRTCGAPFIFTAEEQKHWYEDLGFFIDATAVHCGPCRAAHQRVEAARRDYAAALHAARGARSAEQHLAVARAAIALLHAGGHVSIDKALGHCTRARRLGSSAGADRLSEALRALRESHRVPLRPR